MSTKQTTHTHSFDAKDQQGKTYTVDVFRVDAIVRTRGGQSRHPVAIRLRTREGYSVNPIEKGRYEIVDLGGLEVTTDDPHAPS